MSARTGPHARSKERPVTVKLPNERETVLDCSPPRKVLHKIRSINKAPPQDDGGHDMSMNGAMSPSAYQQVTSAAQARQSELLATGISPNGLSFYLLKAGKPPSWARYCSAMTLAASRLPSSFQWLSQDRKSLL